MFSVDDMKSMIEEWFADASDCIEVAKTYHEVVWEAEKQLDYMMKKLKNEENYD